MAVTNLPLRWRRLLFHRQEGLEALALEVLVRDVGAVRLKLRQKPACAAIVECHLATSLITLRHISLKFEQMQVSFSEVE